MEKSVILENPEMIQNSIQRFGRTGENPFLITICDICENLWINIFIPSTVS